MQNVPPRKTSVKPFVSAVTNMRYLHVAESELPAVLPASFKPEAELLDVDVAGGVLFLSVVDGEVPNVKSKEVPGDAFDGRSSSKFDGGSNGETEGSSGRASDEVPESNRGAGVGFNEAPGAGAGGAVRGASESVNTHSPAAPKQ